MDFQHFASQLANIPHRSSKDNGGILMHNLLRDNFTISTWLALGGLLQGLLLLFARPSYALAPTVLLLSYRLLNVILTSTGVIRNPLMDGVLMGKFTVQLPDRDGNPPSKPGEQRMAVIMLGARTNHPMGLFSPGYKDLSEKFEQMLIAMGKDQKSGFLGSTSWVSSNERHTNNQIMGCLYFRCADDMHRFAHGPLHREAWNWWNSITSEHPHLSIMHELYEAPANHWENIYINSHLSGIANISAPVVINGQQFRPIVDADRGPLSTHKGRLGEHGGYSYDEKQ